MADILPQSLDPRHRLLSDIHPRMAKVADMDVRKADQDFRVAIGAAVRSVRGALSLKVFAEQIDRDERQVARWEDGKERPHFDAIFAVEAFSGPLVLALAALVTEIEITQQITLRRRA